MRGVGAGVAGSACRTASSVLGGFSLGGLLLLLAGVSSRVGGWAQREGVRGQRGGEWVFCLACWVLGALFSLSVSVFTSKFG